MEMANTNKWLIFHPVCERTVNIHRYKYWLKTFSVNRTVNAIMRLTDQFDK